MYLTAIPYQLDCMFFSVELVERKIRNCEGIPHTKLSKSDIVFFLLSQFRLVKVGIDVLIEIIVYIVKFSLFLGVEPAYQIKHRPHIVHNQRVFTVELNSRMKFSEDVFAHFDNIFRLNKRVIF